MFFNRKPSLYAGLSKAVLEERKTRAQLALMDLQMGAKAVSVSYSQGDGARAVTYTQANIVYLQNMIRSLQYELGEITQVRSAPMRVRF